MQILIETFNSVGEVAAGLSYLVVGGAFWSQFIHAMTPQQKRFCLWVFALIFTVGVVEIVDAMVTEGETLKAELIQFVCTYAQVITGGSAAYWVLKARLFSINYRE